MNQVKSRSLNIVMLTTVRFHKAKGGTEKVMIDTANALSNRGHKVTIIFRDSDGSEPGFKINEEVRIINCAGTNTPFWYTRALCDLRSFRFSKESRYKQKALLNLKTTACRYRKAIEETQADVYITYDPKLTAMLVSEFGTTRPIITTFQYDPSHLIKRYYFNTIKTFLVKAGPIQVLLPQFLKTITDEVPQAHCVCIPNAVPTFKSQSTLKEPVIMNVGRLMHLKNQETLIQAMALIHKRFPQWKLKIVGEANVDPAYTNRLNQIITENQLQDTVLLTGPKSDIEKELAGASIFAFPSISEGFGLALAEAMSVGLPSVGLSSCSAVSSLIQDGINGLLCDNNPEDLSSKIIQLIENEQTRKKLGQQAREDIKQYSPSQIWDQWENLLFSLVKQ